MKRKLILMAFCLTILNTFISDAQQNQNNSLKQELPNILWLVSEDNSPWLGCYGDKLATSPHIDLLAREGFLYTHAYANAPVCAPSRNTLITGVYANSSGNENMRSYYPKSDTIRLYPGYLKSIGYYCTNNDKKDYNISNDDPGVWDESSKLAHYKNRKPGQPFFAVFNSAITHESCLHRPDTGQRLNHDPNAVKLAPYHPDTKAMRRDYARFYDAIEDMDKWVGDKLKELDEAGLTDNTIVIYYGDHGGILARSKRFVYETGTRIPFIIRIPEKFKYLYPAAQPGSKVDRLISLIDLAPTLLSITGQPIPGYMQGHAFLGQQKTPDPQYVHMFRGRMDEQIDLSRALRDKEYRYIRNYMPYRIYGQHLSYLWKAPSMSSWEQAYLQGKCNEVQSRFFRTKPIEELYDTEKDPWEVNNLANNPAYKNVLRRMRKENTDWMIEIKDAGLMPEGEIEKIARNVSLYDYMHSGAQSMNKLIAISDMASFATVRDVYHLSEFLADSNDVVRYWAASGLLQLSTKAKKVVPALKKALTDSSADVSITAAEALYRLGYKSESRKVIIRYLFAPEIMVQLHALNVIENSCKGDDLISIAIEEVAKEQQLKKNEYISSLTQSILEKP